MLLGNPQYWTADVKNSVAVFLSKDELFGSYHCPSSKHRNLSGSEGHADATWDHKNRIILYSIPPSQNQLEP